MSIMDNYSKIADYFEERSVLITGATGFIGKVLIEKLLRSCTRINAIYILVRPKKGKPVGERLKHIFDSKLFDGIRGQNEKLLAKVVAIEGDITESNLGISSDDVQTLIEKVSVVFHMAASVNFDLPLKEGVEINLSGTKRMVELSKKMIKLEAFIHVSTAYSNCVRSEIEERPYPPPAPPQTIIDLCKWMDTNKLNEITPTLLGDYPNTYTFTKALTESMIIDICGDIPLSIFRPSVVTASFREPVPGWIDNLNGPAGIMASYVTGTLKHTTNQGKKTPDCVPVDTVVNMMIALSWFMAIKPPKEVLFVNCTARSESTPQWSQLHNWYNQFSLFHPSVQIVRYPYVKAHDYRLMYRLGILLDHLTPAYIIDGLLQFFGRRPRLVKLYKVIHKSQDKIEYFVNNEWLFITNNSKIICNELTEQDKQTFDFDTTQINWYNYWSNKSLGIRRYIFKEDDSTIGMGKNKLWIYYLISMVETLVKSLFPVFIFYSFFYLFN